MYCSNCHILVDGEHCPVCKSTNLRRVCDDDFCFLVAKDHPWDEAFQEILRQHNIPCFAEDAKGVWMTVQIGVAFGSYCIYVPYEKLEEAQELADAFFS